MSVQISVNRKTSGKQKKGNTRTALRKPFWNLTASDFAKVDVSSVSIDGFTTVGNILTAAHYLLS